MVSGNKRDWHDRLPEALWAYRTRVRGASHATPFSLVYGCEAVLPLEIQIPSLRVAVDSVKWVPPSEVRKRTLTRPITDKQERKLGA